MYVDKLDGRIDAEFFDRMSAEWRAEQARCQLDIDHHQTANRSYMQEGVQLLELARDAQRLFDKQTAAEKRKLLEFLVSNCTWKAGELTATFRQPFDMLVETTLAASRAEAVDEPFSAKIVRWLPEQDSNLRQVG